MTVGGGWEEGTSVTLGDSRPADHA
jgi:hypothetical protein